MAVFVRPATWSYDLELFRRATVDEDRLEAMLAAIALADQGLWVVESNQRPVAFAWTEVRRESVRLPLLHVEPGEEPSELLPPLLTKPSNCIARSCSFKRLALLCRPLGKAHT